jgi:transcriptional regulator with XRE-family HTH domain
MKSKPISPKHKIKLETLGLFIKNIRLLEENLSQLELSQQLNLHHNTIQRIEKGANTTLITIFEIAEFFNTTPAELMSIIEE